MSTDGPIQSAPGRQEGTVEVDSHPKDRGHETPNVVLLALLTGAVCLVVLGVHWPVLSAQAHSFDDQRFLTDNPLVRNPSGASAVQFMREILHPSTVGGYAQPLAMITLMLDYAAGGRPEDLRQFHRTSLGLHLVNVALVVAMIHALLGRPWVAAMTGLLFGLHPLTVEPIAWLSQRKTILAACFALGSLFLYLRYVRTKGWTSYGASLIAYAAAMLSKPSSMPVPLLMLLWDYWPARRLSARSLWEKVPFFVLAAIGAGIALTSQVRTMGLELPGQDAPTRSPVAMCYKLMFYLGKVVWPTDLSCYYAAPVPLTVSNPVVLFGVLGTCGLTLGVLVALRWSRAALTGWLFFVVAIFPTLGVVGFSWTFAFDNYVYLPMVGLLPPLAGLLGYLWDQPRLRIAPHTRRAVLVGLAAGVAVLETVGVRGYLTQWRNTERLVRHMLSLAPDAAMLHNMLGGLLVKQGNVEEGMRHLAWSIQLEPRSAETRQNIAAVFLQQGRIDEAIRQFHEALRINPDSPQAHYNLANALFKAGRLDEALKHFERAIEVRPTFADAHNNLGAVWVRLGRIEQAIRHFTEAARLKPDFVNAHKNLAGALARQGKIDEAIEQYRHVLRVQPEDADAHCNLGMLLETQGKTEQAVAAYREVLRLNPTHPIARQRLEMALGKPVSP